MLSASQCLIFVKLLCVDVPAVRVRWYMPGVYVCILCVTGREIL